MNQGLALVGFTCFYNAVTSVSVGLIQFIILILIELTVFAGGKPVRDDFLLAALSDKGEYVYMYIYSINSKIHLDF